MTEVWKGWGFGVFMLLVVVGTPAAAQSQSDQSRLAHYLPQIALEEVFPGADRLSPPEGEPAAAAAYEGDQLLGWVVVNTDWVGAVGYSGKPMHVAVGVDTEGRIVGARMLEHSEPIVLIGIPERRITEFIDGYVGYNVLQARTDRRPPVDIIAGATVTVVVIGDSMIRAAQRAVRSRQDGGAVAEAGIEAPSAQLDMDAAGTRSWEELLGDGSIRRLHLSVGDVNEAFAGDERAADRPERGEPEETFIDLYVALVSAPIIGRSLLGEQGYAAMRQRLQEGQHAILVMAEGRYSFRGSGFVRGGLFDRFELIQDDATIRFRDRDYERIADLWAEGAPMYEEIGLFVVPPGQAFEPGRPWRLQLLVARATGPLEKAFLTFDLPYELPDAHLTKPPPVVAEEFSAEESSEERDGLWRVMWESKVFSIGILSVALAALTGAFFFQDWLVRRPRLLKWFRLGFLAFTLVLLGWIWNAQLSVVNILALTNSLLTDFSWEYFLMDPLIFILWAATAVSLLFWARGAFCGWLCPFGALQEFVNLGAKRLNIRQINVPWGLHERVWPLKYLIFLGLFAISLYSLAFSEHLAEVEPFKTAIILNFIRDWPFVIYAVLLLIGSLFIERFFCRYLCPLGAGLAIPARIRMFDWLKRHRECGAPCQRCAIECPVQAIHPDGRINPNECIYCMHCQELYWDEHRCPHMIQVRLKRERSQAMSAPPPRLANSKPTSPGGT